MAKRRFNYHEAALRYLSGETVKSIAADLGMTEPSVRRALKVEGVKVNRHGSTQRATANRKRRQITDEDCAYAILLRSMGHSWRSVGEEMGIPVTSIRAAIARYQLEMAERRKALSKETA